MPIQEDPENKRPRWDPPLVEDDEIVDDDLDDTEEDEDSPSSSDDEEARAEQNQRRLQTENAALRAETIAVEALRQEAFAIRDQALENVRRIEAQRRLLLEQRGRDLQLLALAFVHF